MREEIHLKLLNIIEEHPNITQRELSESFGMSLGKINYCLKALKEKGFIKWRNFSRNPNKVQYAYLLTPKGIVEKTQLTIFFLHKKMADYEILRQEIIHLHEQVSHEKNFNNIDSSIFLDGSSN